MAIFAKNAQNIRTIETNFIEACTIPPLTHVWKEAASVCVRQNLIEQSLYRAAPTQSESALRALSSSTVQNCIGKFKNI